MEIINYLIILNPFPFFEELGNRTHLNAVSLWIVRVVESSRIKCGCCCLYFFVVNITYSISSSLPFFLIQSKTIILLM